MQQLDILTFIQSHILLLLIWLGVTVAVIFISFKLILSKVKPIDNLKLVRLINYNNAIVVDTRAHETFFSGHIVNSFNVTPSALKENNLTDDLIKHKSSPVIIVDANGLTARDSAEALSKNGFQEVYFLKKGLIAWTEENMPLVRGKEK